MRKPGSATKFGPLTLGLSALVFSYAAVGITGVSIAGAREQSHAEKAGRAAASSAQQALSAGKYDVAVRHAEAAVGFQPKAPEYRMILGQSYLKSGRFASARDAFSDALTLDGNDGRAALHFALAQIATGDWAGARKTIDAHPDTIGIADRGLAIALAGDPAAAVELMTPAARSPGSDAKLRQNLALSLALAGRWQDAKTVVAIDVAPDQVDKRIMDWATFSRPKSASDQVAALLGVTPAVDPGQPAALALGGAVHTPAVAAADPVDSYMPGKAIAAAAPAVEQLQQAPAPVTAPAPVAIAAAAPSGVVFGERHEVAQVVPIATVPPVSVAKVVVAKASVSVAKVAPKVRDSVTIAPVPTRAVAKGSFYVQVGAFENAGVARDAWGRVSRRFTVLSGKTPQGGSITTSAGNFYRLSVGGYARGEAVALCRSYRANGGRCFVRAGAGDQVATWVGKARTQLASR